LDFIISAFSMHHIAIMKKSWGFTDKIVNGKKTIESRWYSTKHSPWDSVRRGDVVYFKNAGEPVSARADISDVVQFEVKNPKEVKNILERYGRRDGMSPKEITQFVTMFKDKKYCILMFLENAVTVHPFDVDKRGFGAMAAWMTMSNIARIKIPLKHNLKSYSFR
jgi:ASC-1-like (ASCH) protein